MSSDDALTMAMRELGVDPEYRANIVEMLETPRERWRACCGSLCTPCVLDLARVVDRMTELSRRET